MMSGNAAVCLVTRARKFYCVTLVMWELHWLPVWQRIRFKTAVLVFRCLHGLAAAYLSEYCKLTTGRSHLRSANACLLSVPHTQTTYGDRSFAVSGTVYLWQVTSRRRLSEDSWRHSYLTVLIISYVDSYIDIDSYITVLPSLPTWRICGPCELVLYKCP